MDVNRTYKDSVFSLLFNDPETLRELYSALEGVTLPPDVPVTINTLEGVLFMERVNDISFAVANKLVVVLEHQSTVNPNMPLRCLLYLARLYEKIIDNKDIYKSRQVKIPRPECFVLYNGAAEYPDETRLKVNADALLPPPAPLKNPVKHPIIIPRGFYGRKPHLQRQRIFPSLQRPPDPAGTLRRPGRRYATARRAGDHQHAGGGAFYGTGERHFLRGGE
jgi:hypothetical protein